MDVRPIDANALYERFDCLRDELVMGFVVNYVIEDEPTLDYVPRKQWISVQDRLPEDDAHYLVWVSDACTVERAMYYGDGEWLTEELDNLTRFVTHWMPLPEPPKEG